MDPIDEYRSLKFSTPFFTWASSVVALQPWYEMAQMREFTLPGIVNGLIQTLIMAPIGAYIYERRRRIVQRRKDELTKEIVASGGSYVVFLRPFMVTNRLAVTFETSWDLHSAPQLEEQLADGLRWVGPLVALGRPGEAFGASRIETDDSLWKAEVQRHISRARLIVLVPGYQDGTLWEMQQILNRELLAKTLFLVPLTDVTRGRETDEKLKGSFYFRDHWKNTTDVWLSKFSLSLPELDTLDSRIFIHLSKQRQFATIDIRVKDLSKPRRVHERLVPLLPAG